MSGCSKPSKQLCLSLEAMTVFAELSADICGQAKMVVEVCSHGQFCKYGVFRDGGAGDREFAKFICNSGMNIDGWINVTECMTPAYAALNLVEVVKLNAVAQTQ